MLPVGKPGLVEGESGDFENYEQDPQHGDQLLNPRAKPQDLLLQLKRVRIEDVDRHDLGSGCGAPAPSGRAWDAILDSAAYVLCLLDQLPKAVVITFLSAGYGSHNPIMVPAGGESTVRERIVTVSRLR